MVNQQNQVEQETACLCDSHGYYILVLFMSYIMVRDKHESIKNAAALESVMLGGAKRILGCSSKTCNEAVRGDMGLETLQGRRDKSKLKLWYKLASMSEDRYPRRVL